MKASCKVNPPKPRTEISLPEFFFSLSLKGVTKYRVHLEVTVFLEYSLYALIQEGSGLYGCLCL